MKKALGGTGFMPDWRGQVVQMAWFLPSVADIDAAAVFKSVWGIEPDQTQRNRVPGPANPFLSVAAASKDALNLQAQVLPGRLDLIVTSGEAESEPLGILFDYKKTLGDLVQAASGAAFVESGVIRLSIILTLLKPVEGNSEGAAEFYKSAGFDPKIENVSDLMFQINARKRIDEVPINRIMQISVGAVQAMLLQMGPQGAQTSQNSVRYVARRHYDFNTVPDGKLIEPARIEPIFSGIAQEILRVAATGSISGLRG
ncbi:hypothetical protein AB6802_09490 [Mesorhizobium sp. RCC_202]|uniref:hypothetical protein n=1 Tax=Mesorhizobium sp. RCC_202 TaxID=3239222 RepID=UPI003525E860